MNQPCQVPGCDRRATYFGGGQWCGDCFTEEVVESLKMEELLPDKPDKFKDIWQRVGELEKAVERLVSIIEERTADS